MVGGFVARVGKGVLDGTPYGSSLFRNGTRGELTRFVTSSVGGSGGYAVVNVSNK